MTTYELVTPDGTPLVDISKIAADRSWSRRRNNSDSVSFKLSVDKWEETCRKLGVHPARAHPQELDRGPGQGR